MHFCSEQGRVWDSARHCRQTDGSYYLSLMRQADLFTFLSIRTVKTSRSRSGSRLSTSPWLNSWTGWFRCAVRFELDSPMSFPLRGCSSAAIFAGAARFTTPRLTLCDNKKRQAAVQVSAGQDDDVMATVDDLKTLRYCMYTHANMINLTIITAKFVYSTITEFVIFYLQIKSHENYKDV